VLCVFGLARVRLLFADHQVRRRLDNGTTDVLALPMTTTTSSAADGNKVHHHHVVHHYHHHHHHHEEGEGEGGNPDDDREGQPAAGGKGDGEGGEDEEDEDDLATHDDQAVLWAQQQQKQQKQLQQLLLGAGVGVGVGGESGGVHALVVVPPRRPLAESATDELAPLRGTAADPTQSDGEWPVQGVEVWMRLGMVWRGLLLLLLPPPPALLLLLLPSLSDWSCFMVCVMLAIPTLTPALRRPLPFANARRLRHHHHQTQLGQTTTTHLRE
jgi:hypothetical protein